MGPVVSDNVRSCYLEYSIPTALKHIVMLYTVCCDIIMQCVCLLCLYPFCLQNISRVWPPYQTNEQSTLLHLITSECCCSQCASLDCHLTVVQWIKIINGFDHIFTSLIIQSCHVIITRLLIVYCDPVEQLYMYYYLRPIVTLWGQFAAVIKYFICLFPKHVSVHSSSLLSINK